MYLLNNIYIKQWYINHFNVKSDTIIRLNLYVQGMEYVRFSKPIRKS